jgi:hypothetical protein
MTGLDTKYRTGPPAGNSSSLEDTIGTEPDEQQVITRTMDSKLSPHHWPGQRISHAMWGPCGSLRDAKDFAAAIRPRHLIRDLPPHPEIPHNKLLRDYHKCLWHVQKPTPEIPTKTQTVWAGLELVDQALGGE